MSAPITSTRIIQREKYSDIIDVRSPSEFAEDHFPGAINLPVLNDEERAEVGTLYKKVNPFQAKKLGAALVSENIANAIKQHFIHQDKNYHPLVYCWRGGQRSMSMATVLSRIGWNTALLEGGYKSYRSWVRTRIDEVCDSLNFIVISGLTGTGKTDILKSLQQAGEQVIDLEGLANHRGSLLGDNPDKPQPSQKYFESLLAQHIQSFVPERPCWIESESNKIGNLHCPELLWQKMQDAKEVEVYSDMQQRVAYLLSEYAQMTRQPAVIIKKINLLKERHGGDIISQWKELIDHNSWATFVQSLLETHYDPAYRHVRGKYNRTLLGRFSSNDIKPDAIDLLSRQLMNLQVR